ncbi:MAG: hypothetical protein HQL78_06965 [Magnetococcales bacterium]|nr:hypothetical protein [Magnetococcales bacterium]
MSSASVLTTVSNLRNLDKMTNFVRASALALTRRWVLEIQFYHSRIVLDFTIPVH